MCEVEKLSQLEKDLKYSFEDKEILKLALTHSSYANENKIQSIDNNERLEFLGDSIIGLIVSQHLYKEYPDYPEGELTKIRAMVVCEPALAYAARNIKLGDYILLGKGEDMTGGRDRNSILADTMEAITGAIYIDSDFETTNDVIISSFKENILYAAEHGNLFTDYKTELQEMLQRGRDVKIEYKVFKEEGPDHNKIFYTHVMLNDEIIGKGKGKNKKESEQKAAADALSKMGIINE